MHVVLRNRNGFPVPATFRPAMTNRSVEQLVDRLFGEPSSAPSEPTVLAPRIDVTETDLAFEVQADLPGVTKEDVKIAVDGKRISLQAAVKSASERKEGEQVIHIERVVKNFARTFLLSKEVDDDRAVAKLENGVLTLILPKKVAPQPKHIMVQ
jgi:HSP20 family protein